MAHCWSVQDHIRVLIVMGALLVVLLAPCPAQAEFTGSLDQLFPPAIGDLTLVEVTNDSDYSDSYSETREYTREGYDYVVDVTIRVYRDPDRSHTRPALTPSSVSNIIHWPTPTVSETSYDWDSEQDLTIDGWPVYGIRFHIQAYGVSYLSAKNNVHIYVGTEHAHFDRVEEAVAEAYSREAYEYILPRIPLPGLGWGAMGGIAAAILLLGGGAIVFFRLKGPGRVPKVVKPVSSPASSPTPAKPAPAPEPPPKPAPGPSPTFEPLPDPASEGPQVDFSGETPPPSTGPQLNFLDIPLSTGVGSPSLNFQDTGQEQQQQDRDEDREEDRDKEPEILDLQCSRKVLRRQEPLEAELSLRLLARDMSPLGGYVVELGADSGQVMPPNVTTGPDGRASAQWSASEHPGLDVRVWGRVASHSGVTDFKRMRNEEDYPARLEAVTRHSRIRTDGQDSSDIQYTVYDQDGGRMEGVAIVVDVVQGGGSHGWKYGANRTDAAGEVWGTYTGPDSRRQRDIPDTARLAARCADYQHVTASAEVAQEIEKRAVRIEVTARPDSLPADGKSSTQARAVLLDDRNDPVPDRPLELFTSPEEHAAGLSTLRGVTDQAGAMDFSFTMEQTVQASSVALIARLEQGEEAPLEGRAEIAVSRYTLQVSADKDRLAADGRDRAVITATLSRESDEPVAGETLAVEVAAEAGQGSVEPQSAATSDQGRAEFTYTAGNEPGRVTLTVSVATQEEVRAETVLEQVVEDFFDIELKHHHMGAVLRFERKEQAVGRHKGLLAGDIASVQVLNNDRETAYAGSVPRNGWLVAALVMFYDCDPMSTYYQELSQGLVQRGEDLRMLADLLEQLRQNHEWRRCQEESLRIVKLAYEAVTLLPGGAGKVFAASCMAMVSTLFGWAEEAFAAPDRVRSVAAQTDWNSLAKREARLTRDLARACEELGKHWADIGPDGGLEYKAPYVIPGWSVGTKTPALEVLDLTEELFTVQRDKAQAMARAEGMGEMPENVLSAVEDLRSIREHGAGERADAQAIRASAEALPALRELSS